MYSASINEKRPYHENQAFAIFRQTHLLCSAQGVLETHCYANQI